MRLPTSTMLAHSCKGEDKWPSQCQPRLSYSWDPMCGETHPPLRVPPFLLTKNLSPKDIVRSEVEV